MSPTTILALQSALVALQLINAGVASLPHSSPLTPLITGSVVGGLQMFLQRLGNAAEPPVKRRKRHEEAA